MAVAALLTDVHAAPAAPGAVRAARQAAAAENSPAAPLLELALQLVPAIRGTLHQAKC